MVRKVERQSLRKVMEESLQLQPGRSELEAQESNKIKEKIARALEIFKRKDELSEIRILNTNEGVVSGYFDDLEQMASEAILYDGKYNIFKTMNPVKPGLKERSPNRLTTRAKQTTADSDIESIQYILIDLDPTRPAGVSATNKEKENALALAGKIEAYFKAIGTPEVIFADSGNGYHLILRVDLENNPENVEMIKKFLKYLHFRFSTNTAEVDQTTYNPARITKLYGTMACKGENTEERPHRRSELLKVPEQFQIATAEQIKAVADSLPEVCQSIPKPEGAKWVIPELIEKYGLDLDYTKTWGGKHTIYVLRTCPWNSEHTNSASFIIQFDNGAVAAGCHHDGCAHENWSTLKEKLGIKPEKTGWSSEAEVLVGLVEGCKFFNNILDESFVTLEHEGSFETLPVNSKRFENFLVKRYYEKKGTMLGVETVNKVIRFAEMKAGYNGENKILFKRVAMTENKEIYYNLANKQHQIIKITKEGCFIVNEAPVQFFKPKGMKEQVMPDLSAIPEDLIPLLKKHFILNEESSWNLFVPTIVTAFIFDIPHPILVIHGHKGAAKTTSMRMMKKIIDPAVNDVMACPSSSENLSVVLNNHYAPCFDNLEYISPEISNLLCMASTGGSDSKRKNYSDSDETLHQFKNFIILNGINVVVTKADLLDRSILLKHDRIKKEDRLREEVIWRSFDEDLPKILGSIFNTLAKAISIEDSVVLDEVGRMADYCYWGYAIGEVLGISGELFLDAYLRNQDSINEVALESNPVGAALMAMMQNKREFSSSMSIILDELEKVAIEQRINIRQKKWPKDASALSRRMNEIKSNLEEVGILFDRDRSVEWRKYVIENINAPETAESVLINPNKMKTQEVMPQISPIIEAELQSQEEMVEELLAKYA